MGKRSGWPKAFLNALKAHGPAWVSKAPHMPDLIYDALLQMRQQAVVDKSLQRQLLEMKAQQQKDNSRRKRWTLSTVILIVALLAPMAINTLQPGQWILIAVAGLLFLWP